jgi:hypothetical protein
MTNSDKANSDFKEKFIYPNLSTSSAGHTARNEYARSQVKN